MSIRTYAKFLNKKKHPCPTHETVSNLCNFRTSQCHICPTSDGSKGLLLQVPNETGDTPLESWSRFTKISIICKLQLLKASQSDSTIATVVDRLIASRRQRFL